MIMKKAKIMKDGILAQILDKIEEDRNKIKNSIKNIV